MLRRLLPFIIGLLLRLLGWSCRLRITDHTGLFLRTPGKAPPVLWVFWHNRILVCCVFWMRRIRPRRPRGTGVLISRSKDGDILAGVIRNIGAEPVRGSSSKGGATALNELARRLSAGCDAFVTPDGPRGPRYSVQPGAVWLAQSTGTPVLVMNVEASSYWRLKSWDGFIIPKPFARIEVTLQPLHHVPETPDDPARDRECARLREILMQDTILQ